MKNIIFTICICIVSFIMATAHVVVFDYDNAGNRIKREISAPVSAAPTRSSIAPSKMLESDFITIGPNPTTGIVRVEISNFDKGDNGMVCVYTTSGILIASEIVQSAITELNITNHVSGIYVFIVETNKNQAQSMVIKK